MIQRFEQFTSTISDIYRSIQKIERDEMEQYGLKGAYAQYLLVMDRYPEGITATALCEQCDKDKAAVSRILSEMEARGLAQRPSGAAGSYRAPIRLTEQGRSAAQFVRDRAGLAAELAGTGLSDANRKIFYASLQLIASNLRAICKDGIPASTEDCTREGE